MSEISALTRLSLARHRWLLIGMITTIALGGSLAFASILWFSETTGPQIGSVALFLALMPAGIASILLFDYGLDQDLTLPESGCSHWILRMPIRPWKIAIVPVVLKSLWVSFLWISFILFAHGMGQDKIPVVMPCVAFSSITVWIMVMSWRPFRSARGRLIALLILLPTLYFAVAGVFVAPHLEQKAWRPLATLLSEIGGVAFYLGGIWCLIRSTALARVSPGGIVQASGLGDRSVSAERPESRLINVAETPQVRGPLRALLRHDYQKSRDWLHKVYLLGVLPATLIFTLFVPVSGVGVIAAFMIFVYLAGLALSHGPLQDASQNPSGLPVYLSASPLSTKKLAWGRQLFPLLIAATTFGWILLVIAGWSCWESNRLTWLEWAETQALMMNTDLTATEVGWRLSAAIVLGVGVAFLSQLAAFAWISLTGRAWVPIVVTIQGAIVFLIPFVIALRWFLAQTNWETTRASALHALSYLPWLVGALLIAKTLATVLVSAKSLRQGLFTVSDLIVAILAWAVITTTLAGTFHLLLPYRFATLGWCAAMAALAIPLSRVLALPLALSWNRHR